MSINPASISVHYHTGVITTKSKAILGVAGGLALLTIALAVVSYLEMQGFIHLPFSIGTTPTWALLGGGALAGLATLTAFMILTVLDRKARKPLEKHFKAEKESFRQFNVKADHYKDYSTDSTRVIHCVYFFNKKDPEVHLFLTRTLKQNFLDKRKILRQD